MIKIVSCSLFTVHAECRFDSIRFDYSGRCESIDCTRRMITYQRVTIQYSNGSLQCYNSTAWDMGYGIILAKNPFLLPVRTRWEKMGRIWGQIVAFLWYSRISWDRSSCERTQYTSGLPAYEQIFVRMTVLCRTHMAIWSAYPNTAKAQESSWRCRLELRCTQWYDICIACTRCLLLRVFVPYWSTLLVTAIIVISTEQNKARRALVSLLPKQSELPCTNAELRRGKWWVVI